MVDKTSEEIAWANGFCEGKASASKLIVSEFKNAKTCEEFCDWVFNNFVVDLNFYDNVISKIKPKKKATR